MYLAKWFHVKVFEKGPYSCGQFNELASSLEGAGVRRGYICSDDANDSEQLPWRGYCVNDTV